MQIVVLATAGLDDGSTIEATARNFIAGMLGEPALRDGTTRAPTGDAAFEIVDGGPIPGFRFLVEPSGAVRRRPSSRCWWCTR